MKVAWISIALLAAFSAHGSATVHWSAVTAPGEFDQVEIFLPGADGLYTGTIMGQVFESTDHGTSWTAVGSGLPQEYAPVQSMVFSGPWLLMSRDGFGDTNFRTRLDNGAWSAWESLPYQVQEIRSMTATGGAVFGLIGGEVYRSEDQGLTWTPVTQPGGIGKLFAHEGRLFATTQSMMGIIYRSDDLGQSWTMVSGSLGSAYVCSHAYWQGRLILSLYYGGGIGAVWSSQNLGTTWQHVSTLPTNRNMNGMAIAGNGDLAIGASGGDEQGQSIWRSGDLAHWDDMTGDLPSFALPFNDLVYHDGWFFKTGGSVTAYRAEDPAVAGVDPVEVAGTRFEASPNPIRDRAELQFDMPALSPVALEIFDASGRRHTRSEFGVLPAGSHRLAWEARDGSGRPLPGGIYFARLDLNRGSRTTRLILLK
jgi:hypothetical protein